jgi:quinone-modifying oxidoreductase subunit QmoB
MVALKQAKYVREDYDDGKALCFISTCAPRFSGKFLQRHAAGSGHFPDQGRSDRVSKNGDGLIVDAENTLLGEKFRSKRIWWCWEPVWCR